ncbi:MAG: magnesium transporter CorA family protein [Sphingomonas sp.]|nr:magnesium transporter CorA family protein [Sphingomonas sp.]
MLRAYGPGCDGSVIDAAHNAIPAGATWIDLDQPTRVEELLVEKRLGLQIPTPEELAEIEPSSRLYEQNKALYMTLTALHGIEGGDPAAAPIAFVLAPKHLVTVRYVAPKPIRVFADHVLREPDLVADALTALCGLLDALVERLADELEEVGRETEKIAGHIFTPTVDARRIPALRLTALLNRIGRAQVLLAKIRETETSTSRLLSFLGISARLRPRKAAHARQRVASLAADTASLSDHSAYLSNHIYFMLDASVGLISIEQNAAMKLFSWVAIIFMPPTLIAGIYGMNFDYMPELKWLLGYPWVLALMLASAVIPLWVLKRRGWI